MSSPSQQALPPSWLIYWLLSTRFLLLQKLWWLSSWWEEKVEWSYLLAQLGRWRRKRKPMNLTWLACSTLFYQPTTLNLWLVIAPVFSHLLATAMLITFSKESASFYIIIRIIILVSVVLVTIVTIFFLMGRGRGLVWFACSVKKIKEKRERGRMVWAACSKHF